MGDALAAFEDLRECSARYESGDRDAEERKHVAVAAADARGIEALADGSLLVAPVSYKSGPEDSERVERCGVVIAVPVEKGVSRLVVALDHDVLEIQLRGKRLTTDVDPLKLDVWFTPDRGGLIYRASASKLTGLS